MDLLIKNAKLRNEENLVDIGVKDGKIVEINKEIDKKAEQVIDAEGRLTAPTFIDPHIHLDKVFTATDGRESVTESIEESIWIMQQIKSKYTIEDVKERAIEAIKLEVSNGCTIIRTHVDVDNIGKLIPLKGVLEAKKECSDIADVQIVAFAQEGILQNEGTEELMVQAMDLGANVVGGMPANEMIDDDSKKHVDIVFEIAKKYNADIDMHVDETKDPNAKSLHYYAYKAIKEKYQGRVSASHCVSLCAQDDYYAQKVIGLLKISNMNIISNPIVAIGLGIDKDPRVRALTRVRELVDAGINVACGQDTISDGFHLFGKGDPLQVQFLMAYVAQYNSSTKAEVLFDMMTINAAKAMRISDYGLDIGKRANINIIDAPNIKEAIRTQPDRLYVIKDGRIVAQNRTSRQFFRSNAS